MTVNERRTTMESEQDNVEGQNFTMMNCDCRVGLPSIASDSIDLVVTDPPYFIDGMGDDWNDVNLHHKMTDGGVVGGLPAGMKFDPNQGLNLQKFMTPIASELYRVLKPGGFCVVFSQARLYHRMAIPFEESGFEIRDMLGWKYDGQAKAFSQDHFIRKRKDLTDDEKEKLISSMSGWKTPQLKPQIEPMVLAQKPKVGTFVDNWVQYGVGLVNTSESLDGMFPGNIMEVSKHERKNDEDFKVEHLTVKPVRLIEHIVKLFTREGQTVLDPFSGSGTTGVSAIKCGRKFIGMEIESKYYDICLRRVSKVNEQR